MHVSDLHGVPGVSHKAWERKGVQACIRRADKLAVLKHVKHGKQS